MSDAIPASEWSGKRIAIAVRTAVKRADHYSPWSNRVVLTVMPPLKPPVIQSEATAQGVRLSWPSEGEGVSYRVYRQGPGDKQPVEIGTSDKPEYVDGSAQYDTHYEYSVVAVHGSAESLMSNPEPITPVDVFPPAIPAGVTALAAPESIELSWQRSPESDLKGYYLYRSVDGSPFVKIGSLLQLPTYSDHDVAHGKAYRYEVSSVDQKDNESDKSKPVEVRY
jgi:fibronectin type 3 domain-containing protein